MAVMLAKTAERCAAERGGSYAGCSKEVLVGTEPSLEDALDRLTVVTTNSTYEVGIVSRRDPSVVFAVSKAANGTTARTCTTNGDRGGCHVPRTGTW